MSTENTGGQQSGADNNDSGMTRREFLGQTTALTAVGLTVGSILTSSAEAATPARKTRTAADPALDLAEWSFFWVGVERADLAMGSFLNGKQMYVEYWVPREVKHPYPIVLVHGGGGQGLDWMGTPDGRRGWAQVLLEQGYRVYVVDRPGHGRSPLHPELHRAFPPQAGTLENISGRFTPPNPTATAQPGPFQHLHNQWVGEGTVGSRDLDQFVASQGGSYVFVPQPPGAAPAGARGDGTPPPAAPNQTNIFAHTAWRERGAMLLDRIGPAVIMTHSAGGPFGWLVAEARPQLVKGIVAIEGGGQPFGGANVWGMSTIPVTFDPPVKDPSEIRTRVVPSPEMGVSAYRLQEEPARKLVNLQNIPIVIVTAEGSFASPGNPGAIAYFKQAGVDAEELRMAAKGVKGNGHMMMVERNSREVLKPITDWIQAKVEKGAAIAPSKVTETAVKLANQNFFWTGTERKKMPYGTILAGQMYVQEMIPAEVKQPLPIVLVHGGGGQMLHYMGVGGGIAGWAHYYLQAGYRVYLVDRPGHGRAPYHPDALGPISANAPIAAVNVDLIKSAQAPQKRWHGTGDVDDPQALQFIAGQNSAPQDNTFSHRLWASRGAELLDRIGPAIIQVHSAGGPFGYLVANERPQLVKGIVNFEGAGVPFAANTPWGVTAVPLTYDPPVSDPKEFALRDVAPPPGAAPYKLQADGSVHKLKNLQGIPMAFITTENTRFLQGTGQVAWLKQAGCNVEHVQFKDLGILGNGHFMMVEENRKQGFDVIEGWIRKNVKA